MKKLFALMVCYSLSLVSGVMAQNLILDPGVSWTVGTTGGPDEVYGKLEMHPGSTLTIPEGTSITMSERSVNNGGTIELNGGDYTIFNRQDFSHGNGGTLLANSGTFSILGGPWAFADNPPLNEEQTQMIIDNAEVFVDPFISINMDRFPVITFVAGGTGFFDIPHPEGGFNPEPDLSTPVSDKANPYFWLEYGKLPEYAGFGLFAPEGETIQIEALGNGHTQVTSIFVLSPSGNQFTWGDLLADGSWGDATGWKENGAATTNIPIIDDLLPTSTGASDPVEVQSGTLRVDTADRGAWSIDVQSGAAAVVSSGNTLRTAEDVTIEGGGAVEARSGGTLSVENNLNVAAGGTLTIADGTVSVAKATDVQGTVAFTGTGTGAPAGGDFDTDGDVDGADFLVWQRGGSPAPNSAADLAAWEANFGQSGSPLSQLILDSGSVAAVTVSSSGVIKTEPAAGTGEVSVGQLTMDSSSLLVKQGSGTLYLEQSGGANSLAAGAQLRIEEGTLVAMNSAANNALGSGTIGLDGGDLVLARTQTGAAPFDAPVQVSRDGMIRAAQSGTGALAGETVTLGGTHAIAISSGAIGTLETADGYTLVLAGDVSGPGQLDFGDGAAVQVQGTVAPAGVGYRGDLSGVSVSGSVAPTSGYFFNPTAANPDMTVGLPIVGGLEVVVGNLDAADGSVGFTGALAHTGSIRLQRGALRLGGADNGPTASQIEFEAHDLNRAAVVESSTATYNPTIGTAAGNVHWTGAGGFASRQGSAGTTVTVNGGAALDWDSDTNGFNGQALQLGSTTADAPVILTNNLNLGSASERVIQVASNPDSSADVARLTGIIASSGTSGDLLRINKASGNGFQSSLLELLGVNTFANTLRLDSGAVYALQGTGLPASANLQFSGNDRSLETVLATSGTFTRAIGTAAGQVSWAAPVMGGDSAQGGGFAARGGPLAVTLAGGTVLWNDPAGFNGQDLHLGSQYADDVVTFNNDLDGQGTFHNIHVFDNPDSAGDRVVLSSDISNVGGLRFPGNGRVDFNGNVTTNTGVLGTGPGNVVVVFHGNQPGPVTEDVKVEVRGESMLFLNGTVAVGEDVQFGDREGGPSIGGSGQVNMFGGSDGQFKLEPQAHLRPGSDLGATGTLTVNLGANSVAPSASVFEMQPDSTYHMEFAEAGGQVVHDSVDVLNEFGNPFIRGFIALQHQAATTWNLELSALESLTGLISPAAEFDLFTFPSSSVKLLDFDTDNFTILDAPILGGAGDITSVTILPSTDFDISGASVKYDVPNGRVYVTGLLYAGPSASGSAGMVPEPAAGLLGVLGIVSLTVFSGRKRRRCVRV